MGIGKPVRGLKTSKGISNTGWRVAIYLNKHAITLNSFEPPTALNCGGFLFNKKDGGKNECNLG